MAICPHCDQPHPDNMVYCPHTGRPVVDVAERMIGAVVANKYRLTELIGQGGMGTIFKAEHTLIGNNVAVKILHAPFAQKREPVERLYREARATGAIGHPNIIKVHDLGETDEGIPFLVMELLTGESLGAFIERTGPCRLKTVFNVASQILSALHAAHRAGIIHRDLKSDNIFFHRMPDRDEPLVKILDFGISKFSVPEADSLKLTQTGSILGTPYYMAPEQASGQSDLDVRLDIFSAGVIFYEMLLGTLPYSATNYNALLVEIISTDVEPFAWRRSDIDEELEAVILKGLARDRENRWSSALDFAEALVQVRDRIPEGRQSMPPPLVRETQQFNRHLATIDVERASVDENSGTLMAIETTQPPVTPLAKLRRRLLTRRMGWIGAAVTFVLAVVISLGTLFVPDPPADPHSPAPSAPHHLAGSGKSTAGFLAAGDDISGVVAQPKQTVRLIVRTVPAHAAVEVNDKPVSKENIVLPFSTTPVELSIQAGEFQGQTRTIVPDRDHELEFHLVPVKQAPLMARSADRKKARRTRRASRARARAADRKPGAKPKGKPKVKPTAQPTTDRSLDKPMDNPF